MNDFPDRWPESVRPFWEALDPYQRRAVQLVVLINAAVDEDHKRKYARRWWGMLEERCQLAALTSPDLIQFSGQLAHYLKAQLGRNAEDRATWLRLVTVGDDGVVLDTMRLKGGAKSIVGVVRAISDARREAAEAAAAFERGEELTPTQESLL